MLSTALPKRACWTSRAAHEVFRTEALEGNDAIFLATHTPMSGFNVGGLHGEEVVDATEDGLLQALSLPSKRHAFCAIQGEPGSGKSHLIRWLFINWPTGNDLPLLLQRSDGSLEGALRQLKKSLPEEFLKLFERIGQKQKAKFSGRAAVFHNTLAALLRPDHYDPAPEDEEWCKRWSPASLLMSERALNKWSAPGRLLRLVSGEGERNSESARFNIFDVAELTGILESDGTISKNGQALLGKLQTEAELINEEREYGQTVEAVLLELGDAVPFSLAFVDALNRRRNDAIQNVLGVSAEGFKDLFREVRAALAKQNKRLVLLLEDITSWEGLDDSLIDVLVTNASTRDSSSSQSDLCDLISVVGLTPQYMRTLKPNYRQRITHEIRLGDGGDDQLQDVVTVRDPTNRLHFVSRYLAATRADPTELVAWRDELREGVKTEPPNKCDACHVRDGCFTTFGEVQGVGLFPFTENAVRGFYEALKEDDEGMTWKTPRGVIQAVLSPTLSHPETLEQGQYPGPHIERSTFTEQSKHLSGALTRLIETQVESLSDAARLRRIFTFWGAGGRPDLAVGNDGRTSFHAVDKTVFEAFQAPWIGDELEPVRPPVTAPKPNPGTDPGVKPTEVPTGGGDTPPAEPPTTPAPDPIDLTTMPVPPADPRPSGPAKLRLNPDDMRTWRDNPSEKLRNPALWNMAVHKIVQSVNPRKVGADWWLWEKFLTQELVKLEGSSKVSAQHFIVPAVPWVFDGLEAFAVLGRRDSTTTTTGEKEYYKRQLARMMRRLERAISAFFDRRLSLADGGARWEPAVAAAQVLLVRAWLRRAALPTDRSDKQWTAMLSDEIGAESNPKARTQPWQTYLDATSRAHSELRGMLRRMVAVPQSGSNGLALSAGTAASAIMQLIETGAAEVTPVSLPPQGISTTLLKTAAEHALQLKQLPDIVAKERELICNRARRLSELLRNKSVDAHAKRIDEAVTESDEELGGAAPDRVRVWKAGYERIGPILLANPGVLEDLITQFVDESSELPTDRPALLSRLISARAGLLQIVLDTFADGETAIDALLVHVEAAVRQNPVDGSGLAGVHEKGGRLMAVTNRIRSLLAQEAQ